MTPRDLPPAGDLPPEWLAGYADGELDPAGHDAVREWLAGDPAARAELAAQHAFGPVNARLWERAEPPEPSAAAWAAVRRGIEDRLNPAAPRASAAGRFRTAAWVVGSLAAAAVAASVAWVALLPGAKPPPADGTGRPAPREVAAGPERAPAPRPVAARSDDPLAGYAVLPVASDDEVSLERVPGTRPGAFPVGRHPLPEELALATADEVHWPAFDLTPVWPAGGPKVPTTPDHAPIIFAAKPR